MARVSGISKIIFSRIILTFIILICMGAINVEAQAGQPPDYEMKALKEIAAELNKTGWNFNESPCDGPSWVLAVGPHNWKLYNNTVTCNCSYPNGECHVDGIYLTGQDLDGVLPKALVKLPDLKIIDFTRNYLSGTIPSEWTSTRLENVSLTVNNLSGPIPNFLGNITTLKYLKLESNMFSGPIPPELGNLVNLEILVLNTNNLTGKLPPSLTNLTRLIELRISSNRFNGKIPDYFQSWKQLQKLEIQASGLEGPIPPSISVLNNLTELRISDIYGDGSKFRNLSNMTSMKRLILRSCNISGQISEDIAKMGPLQYL